MNYIIILIVVILISIFINQYIIGKKEGYMNVSCNTVSKKISSDLLKEKSLIVIQKINSSGIDYTKQKDYIDPDIPETLSDIISFFIHIDTFNIVMLSRPKFFSEVFANTDLTDSDFIVLYSAYNSLIFSLHNIRMSIININPNIKTKLKNPICKNLNFVNADTILNYYKTHTKKYVNTFKKILDNINNTNNTLSSDDVFLTYVAGFTNVYNNISIVKQCSYILLNDLEEDVKETIYPFLDLIRNYVAVLINLLNQYFVPALNTKLKDGQQIRIEEVPFVMPDTKDHPSIKMKSLGDSSLVKLNNTLVQGPGASYA